MRFLIWAGMFLFLTVLASTVATAAMIGMPIDSGVQFGVFAMTALVAGWGCVLMMSSAHLRHALVKARRDTLPPAIAILSHDRRCFDQGETCPA